jgi:hypothetical protein
VLLGTHWEQQQKEITNHQWMKNQDDAKREIIIDQWIWMKLPVVKDAKGWV